MPKSQSRSGKIWIAMLAVLVVVLAGAGTALWLVLDRGSSEAHAASTTKVATKPVFYSLEPFTVNLKNEEPQFEGNLLYVKITFELDDEQSTAAINDGLPQIRDRLLLILSGQSADKLITREGKQQLRQAILASMSEPFGDQQAKLQLKDVLFTQFIVQ